jgi:DNA (cytosine-5)-methyltransferase 1
MLKKVEIIDNPSTAQDNMTIVKSFFTKKWDYEIREYYKNKNKYEFIDLFCGAGGLSLGLENAGMYPKVAMDSYKTATDTYFFNRPYLKRKDILTKDIKDNHADIQVKAPLVVGGPPCQGFSNANKQKVDNDERNDLYKYFINVVNQVTPEIFLMENVEGLLKYKSNIEDDFSEINYMVEPFLINTRDFGIPQNRKRVFFVGIHKKHKLIFNELIDIFKRILLDNSIGMKFTLSDAISDLPKLQAKTLKNSTNKESSEWGYTIGNKIKYSSKYGKFLNNSTIEFPILNHKSKFNNERDIQIYSLLKEGEDSQSPRIEHINPYHNRKDVFKDKFFKLSSNKISKTITAHMYYDCHMYIHFNQARGLTPREAARIQGFTDDYFFTGTPNEWYRQIGNAVSPLLGKIIGLGLKKMLDRINE